MGLKAALKRVPWGKLGRWLLRQAEKEGLKELQKRKDKRSRPPSEIGVKHP
jgi:hypothetical protein